MHGKQNVKKKFMMIVIMMMMMYYYVNTGKELQMSIL